MLKGSGHDKPGPGSTIRSFHENYNCLKNTLAVGECLMGCLFFFENANPRGRETFAFTLGDYSTKR